MQASWGRLGIGWAAAALVALAIWAPLAQAAPPANDNFASREALSGPLPIEVTSSNVEATKEPPWENVGAVAAGHSVWFEWQATITGWVTAGSCTAPFSTVLGVFSGTEPNNLTRVAEGNADEGPHCLYGQHEYTFRATTGTKYDFAVDGSGFYLPESPKPVSEGSFPLRIEATPVPANDDFGDAAEVVGSSSEEPDGHRRFYGSLNGANWNATKESGEPDHAGDSAGASVWYRWTAPESGLAKISACCRTGTVLAVYAGSSLGGLSQVAATAQPPAGVSAPVTAGTTYRIAVDGPEDGSSGEAVMGSFTLSVSMDLAPGRPGDRDAGSGQSPAPSPAPAAVAVTPATILGKRTIKPAQRSATFGFSSNPAGAGFRCKLDGRAFAPCHAPKSYRNLAPGRHTFKVAAVDAAGAVDPTPAVAHFSIPAPPRAHSSR